MDVLLAIERIHEIIEETHEIEKGFSTDWEIAVFGEVHEVGEENVQSKAVAAILAQKVYDLQGY